MGPKLLPTLKNSGESSIAGTKYRATYWGDASAACALLPSAETTPLSSSGGVFFVGSHASRDLGKPVEASEKKRPPPA